MPGAGGLILHSIVVDPSDPERQWVGISSVGVFGTEDGGPTWATRNRGVRADFNPNPDPGFGQCVHKVFLAAGERDVLYQQNHCGVYRSENGGRTWPVGVYFGTKGGELYGSADEGNSWALIASHLPEVWSVDVAVAED